MASFYCRKCKAFRKVDVSDFLNTRKTRIVCGSCNTVLITRQEIYEDSDIDDLYYFEV